MEEKGRGRGWERRRKERGVVGEGGLRKGEG
jgi:hypothetical protein